MNFFALVETQTEREIEKGRERENERQLESVHEREGSIHYYRETLFELCTIYIYIIDK